MKNKKFYFDFEYFPEISYESYILEFYVNGKDLCELKEGYDETEKLTDIYFTADKFKNSLKEILNTPFPCEKLKIKKEKGDTVFELIKKADALYWDKGFELDLEEFWLLYDWKYNHCLTSVNIELCPRVYFSAIEDKIEITWKSDKKFKNEKGIYYVSKELFKAEVLKFIEIMFERREIVEQKLDLVVINGKKISAKRNYDIKMEFEDQMLEELKNVNYNLKTVYELIHMTKKDKIIVPIILKYIKLTNNIYDKANLIRFLGIKGLFEVLPVLEEQLKGEDNLDIRAAILNTISVIKKG